MGSASDYLEAELLDHVLKVGAYAQPAGLFVALYTTAPTDAGGGVEVTGGSYARVSFTDWAAAAARAGTNNTDITFVTATAAWGTIVAAGLFDAVSGGNMLFWDELGTSKVIDTGDTAVIEAGEFDVSMVSGGYSTTLANALIDHVLLTGAYAQPTNLYVALYTSAPGDGGGGTEVTGGSYARENENTWNAASGPSPMLSDNPGIIQFTQATASWGTVLAFGIHDHLTADQLLIYAALDTSKSIENGDTARFLAGDLHVTLD